MRPKLPIKLLNDRLDAIRKRIVVLMDRRGPDAKGRFAPYLTDPVGYGRDVLKISPTPDQATIARAALEPPFKFKVRAGHNVGKTFLFAWLANWWHDTRDPSVVITTAPTERDVVDLLWTEIRLQRARAGLPDHFIGPAAPEMRTSPEHWAKGYTARKGESFQGRHRSRMLFLFDEDEGIEPVYFDRTKFMFKPGDGHAWGSIGNPYTTTSQSAREEKLVDAEGRPAWRLFTLSCLNHPNVLAELKGEPPPVPNAVSLAQVNSAVAEKCQAIAADGRKKTDVEWPPGSGQWYRPGPLFEAGVMGRRPTQGTNSVWSEAAFEDACRANGETPEALLRRGLLPELGCDVAVFGDDWTAIHGRIGHVSLRHESANGRGPEETAGRLKQVCRELAAWVNATRDPNVEPLKPEEIKVKIELDGPGHGVMSHGREWNWIGVSASGSAIDPETYRNVRSELWFVTAARANQGRLDLSRLPADVRARLAQQALSPTYKLNGAGQMEVEPKKDTKRETGRSPDDVDGMDLAYYEVGGHEVAEWVDPGDERKDWRRRHADGRG